MQRVAEHSTVKLETRSESTQVIVPEGFGPEARTRRGTRMSLRMYTYKDKEYLLKK